MTHQRGKSSRAKLPSQASSEANGMNEGITVLAYLVSGVALYGLLGWLGDHYLHTAFLLPIGIVFGAATGIYVIIRRFGQLGTTAGPAAPKKRIDE